MEFYYSGYKDVQMLVYLMKAHNIKKVVVSPGATHISLIGSLQHDDFFEMYSAVDERGAAYMACGLALESGEPVAIACTGATASRNYLPGLSEAYHKKLPILAITGSQDISNNGHLSPQFVDRSEHPVDTVGMSVHLQHIRDANDEWDVNVKINKALLELRRHGGTPVHINLTCTNEYGLNESRLSETRIIRRYRNSDDLPKLPTAKHIAITVGAHKKWSEKLTALVDKFCEENDAIVLVDHSSGYNGKYRVLPTICTSQELYNSPLFDIDLLLHIGEQSGDYYTYYKLFKAKEVWRISEDGEIRDTFHKLSNVFEMSEDDFFKYYVRGTNEKKENYLRDCLSETQKIYESIPELPLSNIWLAQSISGKFPEGTFVHFGVSNTMRSWTFFDVPKSVVTSANVGCRGIDGALSTTLGMSLSTPNRIHYCVLGDLTFFYNMNALGNRNIHNNIRILLINNGSGAEFHLYQHNGHKQMGSNINEYVAASGHNGNQSRFLVRHLAEDLGYEYLTASSKDEVIENLPHFLSEEELDKPIIFEVFTDCELESEALHIIRHLQKDPSTVLASGAKDVLKSALGTKGTSFVKKIVKGKK